MDGLIRNIILLLVVIASIAAVGGSIWLYNLRETRTTTMEQVQSASIGQAYINSVWRKNRAQMIEAMRGDLSALGSNPGVIRFAADTRDYFQKLPLLRVNIYNPQGALLMSLNVNTDARLPEKGASPFPQFVTRHLKDTQPSHRYLGKNELKYGGQTLIQTVIPVDIQKQGSPEIILEIIGDVTPNAEEMSLFWYYCVFGVGGLAFLALLVYFGFSRRMDWLVSKHYEANQELLAAVSTAQAENQDKSQFLANVSHELRTPLNAIIGFSDIIKNEVMPSVADRKYHNFINDIHSSGVHLLSLINDILDYSKAEAGKLDLEVEEINATRVVQNCLRLVSPRAEEEQIRLVDNMPKEQFALMNDGKKFKQVMLNLLSNAVKFTPAGGQVSVTGWHNVTEDSLAFEVRDTGIGIAPKDISRAMAPFGQVDNALKRKHAGTGLGLPLTKKFVELMGGTFMIESEVGVGTRVTFTLPRKIVLKDGSAVAERSE